MPETLNVQCNRHATKVMANHPANQLSTIYTYCPTTLTSSLKNSTNFNNNCARVQPGKNT